MSSSTGDFRVVPFEGMATIWRRFGVKVEKPGQKRGARVHVKNLADGADSEKLNTLFAPFGKIIEADVKKDDSGKSKGFGYVIFATEEEAAKAVAEMNGKKDGDKELTVVLVERKQGKGKDGKGKGKGEADAKGKGKGKGGKGEKGDAKGKGKGKKGKGAAGGMDYSMAMPPYANPYFMPPYGYGMFPPYMYGMPPYGYPMSPTYQAAAMGGFFPPAQGEAKAEGAKGAKGEGKGKGGKGKKKEQPSGPVSFDPPPADKQFKGSLKSISEKNGYGFITCAEAKELYNRDVWVDGDALPKDVKEGDKLSFNITLSSKGHPQASNVKN